MEHNVITTRIIIIIIIIINFYLYIVKFCLWFLALVISINY